MHFHKNIKTAVLTYGVESNHTTTLQIGPTVHKIVAVHGGKLQEEGFFLIPRARLIKGRK